MQNESAAQEPQSEQAPSGVVREMEPDVVRLTRLESDILDQLIERELASTGGEAHRARRGLVQRMKTLGLQALQVEAGMA